MHIEKIIIFMKPVALFTTEILYVLRIVIDLLLPGHILIECCKL